MASAKFDSSTFNSLRGYTENDWKILKRKLTGIVATLSGKDRDDADVREITAWILYSLAGVLRAKPKEDRERTSLSRYLWGAARNRVAGYFRRQGRYLYLADDELIPLADAAAAVENRAENEWAPATLEILSDDVARRVEQHAAHRNAASVASTCKSTREANAQYQRNLRERLEIRALVLRDAKSAGIDIPARVRLFLEKRSAAREAAKSATR